MNLPYISVPAFARHQCASVRSPLTPRTAPFSDHSPYFSSPYPSASYTASLPSPMFPAISHRAPDQDYPSPPTSIPSPGPHSSYHADSYPSYASPSTLNPGTSTDGAGSPYAQPSSIGPVRVPHTRRHTSFQHDLLGRRSSMPSFPRGDKDVGPPQHHSAMYPLSAGIGSRPNSPSALDFDRPQSNSSRLELNLTNAVPLQAQSPYHPVTPTSLSSPYSPYEQRPGHSRSDSETLPAPDRRPTSPANSVASVLTSASSGSMPHHSYTPYPVASSSKDGRPHDKHKKAKLTDLDRKAICLYALEHTNKRQEDIANHFRVERSTISKILKNKEQWLQIEEGASRHAKHRPSKFPIIENDMIEWIKDCDEKDRNMSDSMIRDKAREIARKFHIFEDRFKASAGWVENFKHRHCISRGVWVNGKRRKTNGDYTPGAPIQAPVIHPTPLIPAFQNSRTTSSSSGFSRTADQEMVDAPEQIRHSDSWQQCAEGALQPTEASLHHTSETKDGLAEPVSSLVHQPPDGSFFPHSAQLTQPPKTATGLTPPATFDSHPIYPHRGDPPPSLEEAEQSLNRVLHFVDYLRNTGNDILEGEEHAVLNTVKQALFAHGSGVPYVRPPRSNR